MLSTGSPRRYTAAMILLLATLACSTSTDSGTDQPGDTADSAVDTGDSAVDTGGDTADTGDTEDTAPVLKDVREEMLRSADACLVIGGHNDVPAAQVYYWGEFTGSTADGWTGEEVWYYFGNPKWVEHGLEDCEVHFTVTAGAGNTGACGSCDVGLIVRAQVDLSSTTCNAAQYAGYETMEEPYAVELLGDGSADWAFPSSGEVFGHGYWIEGAMNYLSDGGCELPVD